jgi:metal-responsive CopG/Arc/MetJ family transcriptional regulator
MVERKKTRRENVSLPVGLLRQVDSAIDQSELFTSRARLVEEATKQLLYKLFNLKIVMYGIKNSEEEKRKEAKT